MNPALNAAMASTLMDDRIRDAARQRQTRPLRRREDGEQYTCVTVRVATGRDHDAIKRLEDLEGRRLPDEPALVAEVEGTILAARTLMTRIAVADPFRPTGQLAEMLDLRSVQLRKNGHAVRSARARRFVRALAAPLRSSQASQARNRAQGGPC
jgi:hypothetical protein